MVGDHIVEATSSHIKGTLARHDELWQQCERDLMAQTEARLAEEIAQVLPARPPVEQSIADECDQRTELARADRMGVARSGSIRSTTGSI